jgi:hypothetical protein
MTRADIDKSMRKDGGVSGIYKQERYFFNGLSFPMSLNGLSVAGLVCKLNIDFKPDGVPLESITTLTVSINGESIRNRERRARPRPAC